MKIPPLAYAALVLLLALLIAIALVMIFPTAEECPPGQIALWSDKGWICRD
jgi:hypothetical protein